MTQLQTLKEQKRAAKLQISCFSSYIADDMSRILYTHAEVGMMTKYGGGTAGHFAGLRPRGAVIKDNGHSSVRA
jgi:ribonucleoside-diphosphate reductase alpha chain